MDLDIWSARAPSADKCNEVQFQKMNAVIKFYILKAVIILSFSIQKPWECLVDIMIQRHFGISKETRKKAPAPKPLNTFLT